MSEHDSPWRVGDSPEARAAFAAGDELAECRAEVERLTAHMDALVREEVNNLIDRYRAERDDLDATLDLQHTINQQLQRTLKRYEEGLKDFVAEHMEDLGVRLTRKLVDLIAAEGTDADRH